MTSPVDKKINELTERAFNSRVRVCDDIVCIKEIEDGMDKFIMDLEWHELDGRQGPDIYGFLSHSKLNHVHPFPLFCTIISHWQIYGKRNYPPLEQYLKHLYDALVVKFPQFRVNIDFDQLKRGITLHLTLELGYIEKKLAYEGSMFKDTKYRVLFEPVFKFNEKPKTLCFFGMDPEKELEYKNNKPVKQARLFDEFHNS